MEHVELSHIVEAMIFVSESPVSAGMVSEALGGVEHSLIRDIIKKLNDEYKEQSRAFLIQEVAGGYRYETHPKFGPYLKKMFQQERLDRLSRQQLETLAIIAYKQPVTKTVLEMIRGVNCDGVIKSLLDRGVIKISGRLEGPGRPFVYSTTDVFLEIFGLASLRDLPALRDISEHELEKPESLKIEKFPEQGQVISELPEADSEDVQTNGDDYADSPEDIVNPPEEAGKEPDERDMGAFEPEDEACEGIDSAESTNSNEVSVAANEQDAESFDDSENKNLE